MVRHRDGRDAACRVQRARLKSSYAPGNRWRCGCQQGAIRIESRDPFRDLFDAEVWTKCLAAGGPSIASSEGNLARTSLSPCFFVLLRKLDVVGSSPIARSTSVMSHKKLRAVAA
jgi:hypothetical protein